MNILTKVLLFITIAVIVAYVIYPAASQFLLGFEVGCLFFIPLFAMLLRRDTWF